ncbi:MAG: hypothetical protein KGJ62_13630 [Armatimonadetes bacterium]|nr:hypothetical protein [Armatimonadota bacterium]MDE2206218.1 hypothetical protein [Armatimonadota bacterium]
MTGGDGIWLTEITIRRMHGFPHGGLRVADLSPAINILFGPNGTGKTTLARAIQKAMAPAAEPKLAEVRLLCRLGTDAWELEVRDQTVTAVQNGSRSQNPLDVALHDTPRYILSLEELIATDDGALFAEQIHREAAGGYNVPQAVRELGFSPNPPEPKANGREFDSALTAYNQAASSQSHAARRVETLAQLLPEHLLQKQAASRAALLRAALRFRTAKAALEEFPVAISRLKEDDEQALPMLQGAVAASQQEIDSLQRELEAAEAKSKAHGLTAAVEGVWLASVADQLREIAAMEGKKSQLCQDRDVARAREQSERDRLPAPVVEADPGLLLLNEEFWTECHQIVQDYASCHARRRAMDELKNALSPPESAPDTRACEEAIDCLRQWLTSPDMAVSRGIASAAWTAVAVATAAVLVLAWRAGPFWLTLLAAPLILAFWLVSRKSPANPRLVAEQNWQRLQQQPPSAWRRDEVAQLLRQREEQLARLQLSSACFSQWQASNPERERLEAEEGAATKRAETARGKYGVAPGGADVAGVTLLAQFDALKKWRDAQRTADDTEAAIASITSTISTTLQPIASGLLTYGYSGVSDSHTAELALAKLKDRSSEFERIAERCADLSTQIASAQNRLAQADAQVARFYSDRLLAYGDAEGLRTALAQLPQFLAARDELAAAATVLEENRTSGVTAGVDTESVVRLADSLSDADAAAEVERLLKSADQCDATFKQITEIQAAATQFGDGHALEDALLAVDRRREVLARQREQNVDAVVGYTVADWAERLARESTEPPVQARARELFDLFTNSRYRLEVGIEGPAAFRATDSISGQNHSLAELSSGTRAQLLMAVRLAFIETKEFGLRLPLVLDEVLANSDAERANAIMLAAARIAAEGRQVFYLTAQLEDVHRWQDALHRGGFPEPAVIDISMARQIEAQRIHPWSPPPAAIPLPEDHTSIAYARVLNVPGINPQAPVSQVHLWYFEPSPQELYRLLLAGFEAWGQLEAALDAGRTTPVTAQHAERYRAVARAAGKILETARIGRGNPITRQALIDGGISRTFIGRVDDIARANGNRAAELMAALKAGEVKGLQRKSQDALEEYLIENDHLSLDESIPREECVRTTAAACESDIVAGLLDAEDVRRLADSAYADP